MTIALQESQCASIEDEIPLGVVLVYNEEIIAKAHSPNRQDNDPTVHAEIMVIKKAAKILNYEGLLDCDLYVTKEPCAADIQSTGLPETYEAWC